MVHDVSRELSNLISFLVGLALGSIMLLCIFGIVKFDTSRRGRDEDDSREDKK